jgi:hypothetical protein
MSTQKYTPAGQAQPRSRVVATLELYKMVASSAAGIGAASAIGGFLLWIPLCLIAGGFLELIGHRVESRSIAIPIGILAAGIAITAIFLVGHGIVGWMNKDSAEKEYVRSLIQDARGIGLGSIGAGTVGGIAGALSGVVVSLFVITVIFVCVIAVIVSVFAVPLLISFLLLLM